MYKVISVEEAAELVRDGDDVAIEGFLLNDHPKQIIHAIRDRFDKVGQPRDIHIMYVAGIGSGKDVCVNRLAKEGLLKRVTAAHYNLAPDIGRLILANKIEGYNIPQGAMAHLFRDSAAGKAGTLSSIGIGTFADPRNEACRMNEISKDTVVELVTLNGMEQLFYKRLHSDICFLRGTYADEKGNISFEKEAVTVCNTAIAIATHNQGGKVVVQVSKIVKSGAFDPKLVKVPGSIVDYIVVVPEAENMSEVTAEQIAIHSGKIRVDVSASTPKPLNERKVIARRAAIELFPGAICNLGIGVPEWVADVAAEEGINNDITLTVESGVIGGVPLAAPLFGAAINPECILDQPYQFDLYDGGGLDRAFVGLGECDAHGNVNVSKLSGRYAGSGGFIDISQNSKMSLFLGSFTTKGLEVAVGDGKFKIVSEGSVKKFLNKVGQITFSGVHAAKKKQKVLYITERAVFELHEDGLHLIEIAPGVEIEKDILNQMEFAPVIKGEPKLMDLRIFKDAPMGLA